METEMVDWFILQMAASSQVWSRPNPGPGTPSQSPTRILGSQNLGHLLLLPQAHQQGARSEVE